MWQEYAPQHRMRSNLGIRRRLAPLLDGDRRQIELLNAVLLSLPGSPFLYYGDELGMGDNIELHDRDGVRTPMQWDASPGAGFSEAPPESFHLPIIEAPGYGPATVSVAAQQGDADSLLEWTRRALASRARHPVFGEGAFRRLEPDNRALILYERADESETIIVAANFSSSTQRAGGLAGSASDLWSGARVDLGGLELSPFGYTWLLREV